MSGFDLRSAQDNDEAAEHILTVGADGSRGNGKGEVIPNKTIGSQTRGQLYLTNRIAADNPYEGIWDFLGVGIDLLRNSENKFRIGSLQPSRSSVQVQGNIVGGTSDSTRVAGASFLLNAYTLGGSDVYLKIGEAFNGFIHKDNDPTYGDIFSDVELYRTNNNYLALNFINGSSIQATGCTIYLRLLMSESV